MPARLNYMEHGSELGKKLIELGALIRSKGLEPTIIDLVQIRASQINHCAFCLDMHVKQAKIHGERELRIYHIPVWRESPLFSERERAALEWTEAVTLVSETDVPDDEYQRVSSVFSEKEMTELTFAVALINAWNRISVSFRVEPGSADAAYGLDKAGLG